MPNDEKAWEPTWLYCLKNNKPVSQLFLAPPEDPENWHDEPQKPRGPGRPKGSTKKAEEAGEPEPAAEPEAEAPAGK